MKVGRCQAVVYNKIHHQDDDDLLLFGINFLFVCGRDTGGAVVMNEAMLHSGRE